MSASGWNKGKQEEFKERKVYKVGAILAVFSLISLTGCNSSIRNITESASSKNLDLSGYVMYTKAEASSPETATPTGTLIIGRVNYKSRKVGIPADQKVPTTGNFKATKTTSIFGTTEEIIEYDFTAGNEQEAQLAIEALEKRKKDFLESSQK